MTSEPPEPGADDQEQISYYRLDRVLGRGGFGVVYEATDVRFNTRVAVKLLHAHLTDDEAYRERFLRETHVVSLLRSPYTVQVHQSGVADGRYFLVMDLIDGGSVADLLRSGPLEPKRALRIAGQVARSLEEAELRRITHRDIKPENVMLTADGTVQLVDFGIARQAGAGTLTGTGQFVGTPVYTAPETAMGRADHRSDIYSVGVTLYHMLTGRPPFSGEPLQVLAHHERTPLPWSRWPRSPGAWWKRSNAAWRRTRPTATRARRSWPARSRASR
jgi:serine/threonine-protein kinase